MKIGMPSHFLIYVLISLTILVKGQVKQQAQNDTLLYRKAIQTAMYPEADKVYTNLVPITKSNTNLKWKKIDNKDYLLVVTWKQNISYYEPYLDSAFYNTGSYPIWITTSPELLQRMKNEKTQNVNKRLKQLLGLPPNAEYSYFVEFWVQPSDLFRPCPDNEITDKMCEVCFPSEVEPEYVDWINESRISRYYQCELFNQYPWSQLGYTFDWSPQNLTHIGLSEFVIGENKNIVVNAIYTTEEYLDKAK